MLSFNNIIYYISKKHVMELSFKNKENFKTLFYCLNMSKKLALFKYF